jgi:hypothetical protein
MLFKLSCDDFFINTTNGTSVRVCEYNYNGQGFQYQVQLYTGLYTNIASIFITLFLLKFYGKYIIY